MQFMYPKQMQINVIYLNRRVFIMILHYEKYTAVCFVFL